jgi:chromosomal replication initiation ATPase DnaA
MALKPDVLLHPRVKRYAEVMAVQVAVADAFGVPVEYLTGSLRGAKLVTARYMAIMLCADLLEMTITELADVFRRDYSTIRYALQTGRNRMTVYPGEMRVYEFLFERLSAGGTTK